MADGFGILSEQHRDVERLFDRYFATPDDATAREICELLTQHAETEEQALYPELRRIVDGGDDLADRAVAEHGVVKTIIARVYDSPPGDLGPLLEELRTNVTAHVRFEEEQVFPEMAEAGVDGAKLATLVHAATGEAPSQSSGQVG